MFEFFIAKKYLIPKKHQLSASLIALLSIGVISLVVWLLLVFLSVTEGIEKNWQKKLTALNAPITISLTSDYKRSYYHLIDTISASSGYSEKSIHEKRVAGLSDPYNETEDYPIPAYWPKPDLDSNGSLKDPIKELFNALVDLKNQYPSLVADDFEIAASFLKLKLIRPHHHSIDDSFIDQSYLSQMCYLGSITEERNPFHELLQKPSLKDIQHLLFLASLSSFDATVESQTDLRPSKSHLYNSRVSELFESIKINESYIIPSLFTIDPSSLDEGVHYDADYDKEKKAIKLKTLSNKKSSSIVKESSALFFIKEGAKQKLPISTPITVEKKVKVELDPKAGSLKEKKILFPYTLGIQNKTIKGLTEWKTIELTSIQPKTNFNEAAVSKVIWPYFINNSIKLPSDKDKDQPVLLPKNFKDSGVLIGDRGYLSYSLATASSIQEQRLPIYVAGFYDPGVLSIGNRYVLLDKKIVHQIAAASKTFSLDEHQSNGIHVWFDQLDKTSEIALLLREKLKEKQIDQYFKITPYQDYDFAKDLLLQFKSDKVLFSLIGSLILIVACSNIVSFLIIMINDKKKEIAILQSMGAKKSSLLLIFSLSGAILGLSGSLLGTFAAYVSLKYINQIVNFLSVIQGQPLFLETFYGASLPTQISDLAVIFILIAAPCLSLIAGFIPAFKASKLNPSHALRSQ